MENIELLSNIFVKYDVKAINNITDSSYRVVVFGQVFDFKKLEKELWKNNFEIYKISAYNSNVTLLLDKVNIQ